MSREHALIHRSSSGVRVEDIGSKYGVYVNNDIDKNKPIEKKTHVLLHGGNIVRFGRLDNIYRLENIIINVCTSTMAPDDIIQLKKQLKIIEGTLQSVWSTDCTHLIMSSVTVTVKVLQSLAYGVPIVSPAYFDAYLVGAKAHNKDLPDVKSFVPEITEPYIIKERGMMEVHLDRQRLFQNKSFVFMVQKQMDRFSQIIPLAGGKCINIGEGNVRKSFLLKNECIPVQYTASSNSQCSTDVENIVEYIQKNGRRLIAESEIGLAIIHRAIDRFCNPDRKMLTDLVANAANTNEIAKNVLVEETAPSNSTEKAVPSSIVVPETIEMPSTAPNNNLRNDEVIDLDKTPTARRSTRSSKRSEDPAKEAAISPVKTPTKGQKRKLNNPEEPADGGAKLNKSESEPAPQKKQRLNDSGGSQGESSAHSVEAMPLPSQNNVNFSGFISTQQRRRAPVNETFAKPASPEQQVVSRKRVISMLTADSDEDDDKDDENGFNFNRKSKRTKATLSESQRPKAHRIRLDDSDDDDDSFNFTKRPSQTKQANAKATQNTQRNEDGIDGPSNIQSQPTYRKPFETANRSVNRSYLPERVIPAMKCDASWITMKIKTELNLNDTPNATDSPSYVKVKQEKLEEWEMTDVEQKRQWTKSLANAFSVRKFEVTRTIRPSADEADSFFSGASANANKTKNFKKFVKVQHQRIA